MINVIEAKHLNEMHARVYTNVKRTFLVCVSIEVLKIIAFLSYGVGICFHRNICVSGFPTLPMILPRP